MAELWLDAISAHGKLIFDMSLLLQSTNVPGCPKGQRLAWQRAKARGRLGGRLRTMTEGKIETALQLRSEGHTLKDTAQRLSVSGSSLTRALSQRAVLHVKSARS